MLSPEIGSMEFYVMTVRMREKRENIFRLETIHTQISTFERTEIDTNCRSVFVTERSIM